MTTYLGPCTILPIIPRQPSLEEIRQIGICRYIQDRVEGLKQDHTTCALLTALAQEVLTAMLQAGMLPPIANFSLSVRETPAWYERFETNPVLGPTGYVIECNFPSEAPEYLREQWLTAFSGTQQEYEAWCREGMPGLIRPEIRTGEP
jgi:hypothetical protein